MDIYHEHVMIFFFNSQSCEGCRTQKGTAEEG